MSTPTLLLPRPQSTPPTPRQPLTPTRTTPLSVHLFQARHALQFAHLHTDAPTYLQAEAVRLEEERRLGREKRESLASISQTTGTDNRDGFVGKRPLSLVSKHQLGITRPTSHQIHRGRGGSLQITVNPRQNRSVSEQSRPIPPLGSLTESDTEPESNFYVPEPSPPILPGPRNTLTISIRSSHSSHSKRTHPNSNSSRHSKPSSLPHSQSTYSWASSFSGETSELRTAAHYVPSSSSTPDIVSLNNEQNHTEYLNSPEREKTDRRRKRIVAIAHTVRQLEGVGSREVEDPELYGVLVKAWNERHGLPVPGVLPRAPPPHTYPPTGGYAGYDIASPPDPDFRTPSMDGDGSFTGSSVLGSVSGEGSGSGSGDLSRSTRYSYASTLHDLALDGGLEVGGRLMKEKAWLRGGGGLGLGVDLDVNKRYGVDDVDFSPPVPPFLPPVETRRLESPINLPGRTLRRQEGTIATRPGVGEAGPSHWGLGLGFTEAWWDTPQKPIREAGLNEQVADFHQGEVNPNDRALYSTPPRKKRISRRNSSPLDRTSLMSGMGVLEVSGADAGRGQEKLELGSAIDLSDKWGRKRRVGLQRGSRCLSHCRRNTIHSIISCRREGLEVEVKRDEGEEEMEVEVEGEEGDGSIGLDKSSLQLTPVQIVRASISHLTPGATPIYTQFTKYKQILQTPPSPTPTPAAILVPGVGVIIPKLKQEEEDFAPQQQDQQSISTRDHPSQVSPLDTPVNPTIPFNSHPSHPQLHFDRFSYPGMSGGNDTLLPTLEPLGGGVQGGVNLPSSVMGLKQKGRVHTPPLHTIATMPVDSPIVATVEQPMMVQEETAQTGIRPVRPKRSNAPSILFFLGFLLPFLWLVGGWMTKSTSGDTSDLEKGEIAGTTTASASKPWYIRWAYHPDPWIRRCRIATGVTASLLVTGGILAAILVTTLR